MKAINVSRVSTEEQKEAGNSLPAQIERIRKYCERKGFDVAEKDIFSFDESAYKEKRDDFDSKVIARIDEIIKKEKVAVCFDKVDRLARNVFDKRVAYLYQLALEGKIELHFVSDNQIISDKLSATEKSGFSMSLVMASYYSNAISDNVKRAFEQKRRNGEWTGAVRLGYLNVQLDVEKRLRKDIEIDPERGYLIQKMFELYATDQYSLEAIRNKMTELGLRTRLGNILSKSGVENILKDSFYCGVAMSKKYGNYAHKYPKLITRELFDKCQQVRNKDTYDKKHQELQDKIQELEIEMSEHSKADYEYQNTVATVISVARRAKTIFDNSSEPARKRQFLNYILQNPTVNGKKLYFTIASPFNLVLELASTPNWLPRQGSNLRPIDYTCPSITGRGGLYHLLSILYG